MNSFFDKIAKIKQKLKARYKYFFFRVQKNNRKKNIQLILLAIILVILALAILLIIPRFKNNYTADPAYCEADSDCVLYQCTNCGNQTWIEKNKIPSVECTNRVPGLVGCNCIDNKCKRKYER